MEGPVGLEPTTPCLKGRCSNRLSYGPILWAIGELTPYIIRSSAKKSICCDLVTTLQCPLVQLNAYQQVDQYDVQRNHSSLPVSVFLTL